MNNYFSNKITKFNLEENFAHKKSILEQFEKSDAKEYMQTAFTLYVIAVCAKLFEVSIDFDKKLSGKYSNKIIKIFNLKNSDKNFVEKWLIDAFDDEDIKVDVCASQIKNFTWKNYNLYQELLENFCKICEFKYLTLEQANILSKIADKFSLNQNHLSIIFLSMEDDFSNISKSEYKKLIKTCHPDIIGNLDIEAPKFYKNILNKRFSILNEKAKFKEEA